MHKGPGHAQRRILASKSERLVQKSKKIEHQKVISSAATAAQAAEADLAARGQAEIRAETESFSQKKTKQAKMADSKNPSKKSAEGPASTPKQSVQKITAMLKSKPVSEWKGQHPSFEHFPQLTAANKQGGKVGDDSQQKAMARYVASNTDKIIGRQMAADTAIIEILNEMKADNRNKDQVIQELQNQIGELINSHADLVEIVTGLRRDHNSNKYNCRCNGEVSSQRTHTIKIEQEDSFELFEPSQGGKQNMSSNTNTNTTSSSYAGVAGAAGTEPRQSNNGNKAGHQNPRTGHYPTGHPNHPKNNDGNNKPPYKRTTLAVNKEKNNVEEVEIKGGHRKPRWKNVPEEVMKQRIEKNERETRREVIFCNVPSPKSYEEGTAYEDARHVFCVLDELRTEYLGNTYGVNVKSTDFAFATRQLGHWNKDFLPITARFRTEEIVNKILAAAKWAKILNRRKKSHYGKHKIPFTGTKNERIEPSEEALKMDQERPMTFLRASRTYAEQDADRVAWNRKNSIANVRRTEVNEFRKRQRISQEHFNQIEIKEAAEHDPDKYGCPPPPPEPDTTEDPDVIDDPEVEDEEEVVTEDENLEKRDGDDDEENSFKSAKSESTDEATAIVKTDKSKPKKVTTTASD